MNIEIGTVEIIYIIIVSFIAGWQLATWIYKIISIIRNK